MAAQDVYVDLASLLESDQNVEQWARPTVPGAHKFERVAKVVKDAIRAAGNNIEDEVFAELDVTISAAEHKLTLSLDQDGQAKRYIVNGTKTGTVELNYSVLTFASVMVDALGFARVYEESQLDAVKAALDAVKYTTTEGEVNALTHSYNEQTQKLTVKTVEGVAGKFSFKDSDLTPSFALFGAEEFVISFADDAIDIAKLITNRDLTIAVADLVVKAPAAAEPSSAVAA